MQLNENVIGQPKVEKEEKLPPKVLARVTYNICNIGEANANKRVYTKDVWEKVLADSELQRKLQDRTLYGHGEHPDSSASDLMQTSHIIHKMWIDEKQNKVFQTLDIVDTDCGKCFFTLLEAGSKVGVSTRAEGELEEMKEGDESRFHVIPDKYKYITTDATSDASTFGSIPFDIKKNVVTEIKKIIKESNDPNGKKFAEEVLDAMKCKDGPCTCGKCGACDKADESKVNEITGKGCEYRIKKNADTNEWMVVCYIDGKRNEKKTYYTDDKQDAEDTMADLKKREQKKNESVQVSVVTKDETGREKSTVTATGHEVKTDVMPDGTSVVVAIPDPVTLGVPEVAVNNPVLPPAPTTPIPSPENGIEDQTDLDNPLHDEPPIGTEEHEEHEEMETPEQEEAEEEAKPNEEEIEAEEDEDEEEEDQNESKVNEGKHYYIITEDEKLAKDVMSAMNTFYDFQNVYANTVQGQIEIHFESDSSEDTMEIKKAISRLGLQVKQTNESKVQEALEDSPDETDAYVTWACEHGHHGGCRGSVCDCECHPHDGHPPFSTEQAKHANGDEDQNESKVQEALEDSPDETYEDEDGNEQSDEEHFDDEPTEPQEEDITYNPTGPLGSQYSVDVVNGGSHGHIGTFDDYEQVADAIRAYCGKHNFYPNVWSISDHGNAEIDTDIFGRIQESKKTKKLSKRGKPKMGKNLGGMKKVSKKNESKVNETFAPGLTFAESAKEIAAKMANSYHSVERHTVEDYAIGYLQGFTNLIIKELEMHGVKYTGKVEADESKKSVKSILVSEASMRAERDKAFEELNKLVHTSACLISTRSILEKVKSNFSTTIKENTSIKSLLEKKAQKVKELSNSIEKLTNENKQIQEKLTKETYNHKEDLIEAESNGRKAMLKDYFEHTIQESKLAVQENIRALLEDCNTIEDVNDLLQRAVSAGRRALLSSPIKTAIVEKMRNPEADRKRDETFEMMDALKRN